MGNRYYENLSVVSPSFRGNAYGSNWVDLTASGATVDLPIIDHATDSYITYNDYALGRHKTLSRSGDEGINLQINGDFSNGTDEAWELSSTVEIIDNAAVISPAGALTNALVSDPLFDIVVGRSYLRAVTCDFTYSIGTKTLLTTGCGADIVGCQDGVNSSIDVATATPLKMTFRVGNSIDVIVDDFKFIEVLPTGTTYTMTDTFQSYFATDVPVTEADRAILDADPEAVYRLWLDNDTTTGLSFVRSNIKYFISGNEGSLGNQFVQDLVPALGSEETALTTATVGTGNTISADGLTVTIHCETTTAVNYRPTVKMESLDITKMYLVNYKIVVSSGTCEIKRIAINDYDNMGLILGVGTHYIGSFGQPNQSSGEMNLQFNGIDEYVFDAVVTVSVREAIGYEITNYSVATRTNLVQLNEGASDFLLYKDGSGRPTGITPYNSTNFAHDGTIETQFIINTARWTITEAIYGRLEVLDNNGIATGVTVEKAELRVLRSDGTYKVDDILQTYTPTMPTTGVLITLDKNTLIGYDEVIGERLFKVKFNTDLSSDVADTDLYNELVADFGYRLLTFFADIQYDDTNIATEFTGTKATVSTDEVVATDYDGYAIANDIGNGSTDMVAVVAPFDATLEFANSSEVESSADELITITPIYDGDNLVIVTDDDTIHEMVAVNVVEGITDGADNPSEVRATEILTAPDSRVTVSSTAYVNPSWWAFNGVITNNWNPVKPYDAWIKWTFDEGTVINKAGINANNWGASRIEGSNDGSDWTILDENPSGQAEGSYVWFTWINRTKYTQYRLVLLTIGNVYMGINDIIFVEADPTFVMDTTTITAGETPSRAFAVDANVSFSMSGDYIEAEVLANSYSIESVSTLKTTRTYRNVLDRNTSLTLSPKVTLKNIGDKLIDMKFTVLGGV